MDGFCQFVSLQNVLTSKHLLARKQKKVSFFAFSPSPMGQNFTKARLPVYLLERAFSVLSIIYLLKVCPIVGACAVRIQQSSGFPGNKLIRCGFLFPANVSVT